MSTTYRVGISGSYGGLNLGDEAILQCMIRELRASLPVEISVFSRNPEDTRRRHRVEKVVAVRDLAPTEIMPDIEGLDLLLLGGGGILFDAEAKIFLREVEIAHEKGVPVMLYAAGAGPLTDPAMQQAVRKALDKAALITVRERSAKKTLEEIGVKREIIVTADPALLLEPEPLPEDTLKREQMDDPQYRLVAMSVREPGPAAPDIDERFYRSLLANAADFVIDRLKAHIIFVPMERRMRDMQQSHAIISQMLRPQHAWVLKGDYTPGQILSLLGRFQLAVGMRLHFLIFSALQGVPFVALPYAEKVAGLLDELRLRMPPFNLVNAGRLIAHIDQAWDERNTLVSRAKEYLPVLKERARETNRLAVKLLTQRVPGKAPVMK